MASSRPMVKIITKNYYNLKLILERKIYLTYMESVTFHAINFDCVSFTIKIFGVIPAANWNKDGDIQKFSSIFCMEFNWIYSRKFYGRLSPKVLDMKSNLR